MGMSSISATSAITKIYANQTYAGWVENKRAQEPGQMAPSPAQKQTPDVTKRTGEKNSGNQTELSTEQLEQLTKLRTRDREVRQHEAAHLAASGGLAVSGASFSYQKGPDGISYAVGGEVQIDTSPGRTPQESLERARTIQTAALAPAQPSGQDMAVAAAARKMEMQARAELAQQATQTKSNMKAEDNEKTTEPDSVNPAIDKAMHNHARAAQAYATVNAITDLTGLTLGTEYATARRSQVSAYA